MTDEEKQAEAAELAKRARAEGKNAAKNAAQAVKAGAEAAEDAVAEEVQDTAQKLEGTAEDAVEAARRVNPWVLGRISSDTGIGFFALSVSIYSGAIAFYKFRSAIAGRSHVMTRQTD